MFPQLGSVAQQSGSWAASNILAGLDGKPARPFHYLDKGIMAMIGRGAAVAEVGHDHHGLHGAIAFAGWLGVHAALMSGVHNRVDAFVQWAGDYSGSAHGPYVLDRSDDAHIDWGDDPDDIAATATLSPVSTSSATSPTSRTRMVRCSLSSGPSPSRVGRGPHRTSWPGWTASRLARSTTSTRGSWR